MVLLMTLRRASTLAPRVAWKPKATLSGRLEGLLQAPAEKDDPAAAQRLASWLSGKRNVVVLTGAGLSTNWEYDLELAIRGDAMDNAPDWLKPFNLRNRVAFVDQFQGDRTLSSSFTEYRIQLNYELTWKGPRLR